MTDALRKSLKVFADLGIGSGPDHETETYRIERGAIRNARAALESAAADSNASAEARDFCTYGPPDERKRQWIIVFEDADRGMMIFSDEREAHTSWDKAKDNWTCTLFETSERKYHWAAGELRPLNASAEARLREALRICRDAIQSSIDLNGVDCAGVLLGALSIADRTLSIDHASDCEKQGECR